MSESPMSRPKKPRLAISTGDLAGVGPELILDVIWRPKVLGSCTPVVVGPVDALHYIAAELKLRLPHQIERDDYDSIPDEQPVLISSGDFDVSRLAPGVFDAATGQASFDAVCTGIELTLQGTCDALVTGPIQKEAWHLAGTGYLGHTEVLADRTGASEYCMMLSSDVVSSVLCTIHLPLADAIEALTVQSIARAIRLGGLAMQSKHGRPPRIVVLGLNPHAGEHGLLSRGEEEQLIRPAIESVDAWQKSQTLDWKIRGPVSPDTAFTPAMREQTDVHICMYHDQGLIPLKALSFDDAVNVTLGLPIIRTSVDHGTAMDLAWKRTASPESLLAAIRMAVQLCGTNDG